MPHNTSPRNIGHEIVIGAMSDIDIGYMVFHSDEVHNMMLHCSEDELVVLMPQYIIQALCFNRFRERLDPNGALTLMGKQITPGYEDKIIVYHPDYPMTKNPALYYELDLRWYIDKQVNHSG